MTIGSMIGDIVESLFKKPVTQQYPFERKEAPERFRGRVHYEPGGCTGCQLCVKDCPAYALELITIDKAANRFVMRYHMDRCVYCGQCVISCRFSSLRMAHDEWELAATSRSPFVIDYGLPEDLATLHGTEAEPEPDACRNV